MGFVHRSLGTWDLYWVNTTDKKNSTRKVSFRATGKEPEIWDPLTGQIVPASYAMDNERTE